MLVDSYTFVLDVIGTRATGNQGGTYMIVGPDWKGETPKGIDNVYLSEAKYGLALYRTQLLGPGDLEAVKKVRAGHKAEQLSAFFVTAAPPPAPAQTDPAALTPDTLRTSLQFFDILNFVLCQLQACHINRSAGSGRRSYQPYICPRVGSGSVPLANLSLLTHATGMTTDPKIDPIKKRKLADDVQDRLLAFIAEEGLSPGDALPSERDLMVRHQVGRTAIREAMQNMQRMGLIDIRHGERPRVAAPDMVGMVDQLGQGMRHMLTHSAVTRAHLQDARTTFEAEMARIAAERCSAAQAQLLHILLDDHRQAQSDPALFVKCDGAFHRAIAGIGGNPIFELLSGSLFEWLSQFHVDMVRSPGLELLTLGEHEAIVDAITSGKAESAKEAMVQHLTRANLRYRNGGS